METVLVDPEDKKRLTSLNLAHGGWLTARTLLSEIESRALQPDFGIFEGVMVGVCILYGRPFKRAKGLIRLDELSTFDGFDDSAEMAEIHQSAMEARDVVLAHQDVGRWSDLLRSVPGTRPANEAIITFAGGPIGIESGALLPQANLHVHLPRLIDLQLQRVDHLRFQLIARLLPSSFAVPAQFRIEARPESEAQSASRA